MVVFFLENPMTQTEIDHAVAQTLGEDIHEIRSFGFSMLDPQVEFFDPECDRQDPQVLDWEGCAGERDQSVNISRQGTNPWCQMLQPASTSRLSHVVADRSMSLGSSPSVSQLHRKVELRSAVWTKPTSASSPVTSPFQSKASDSSASWICNRSWQKAFRLQ